jgi:hypothetical protein
MGRTGICVCQPTAPETRGSKLELPPFHSLALNSTNDITFVVSRVIFFFLTFGSHSCWMVVYSLFFSLDELD